MLKYRLIFGTLMTLVFAGVVLFDPWSPALLVILVALMIILGSFELSKLAAAKGMKILLPVSIPATVMLATCSYWNLFFPEVNYTVLLAFGVMACFLYQHLRYGIPGVLANCSGGVLFNTVSGPVERLCSCRLHGFWPLAIAYVNLCRKVF